MTQTATVTKILDDKTAEVTVERGTACGGSCHSCGGTCSFKNKLTASAINTANAALGDKVTIQSHSRKVLGIAVLLYIVPIVTLLFGYIIPASFKLAEVVCIIFAVAGLVLGQMAVTAIGRRRFGETISFEIVEIE